MFAFITPDSARYSYPSNSQIPSFFSSSEAGSSYSPKFALSVDFQKIKLVSFGEWGLTLMQSKCNYLRMLGTFYFIFDQIIHFGN